MNRVFMIGNTHFDPVWLWTWDEGLSSIRSTFRAALDRMDEDEGFVYSFSCPPVFEQLEKVDPALMSEIERRVREGRWALDEGMWVQPDCYSACLESYIRQCLHAQLYLRGRFGRFSDTAFNIDSFGHSAMLPQVLLKARLPYSVISRPDEKDMALDDPLFRWESPDSSRVTVMRANIAGPVYSADTGKIVRDALEKLKSFDHDLMLVYGVTNHGGAPTRKSIAEINALNEQTGGRVLFGSTTDFFAAQKDARLPVLRSEIPIRHFGVFFNRPDIKKANRQSEYALLNAERAALMAYFLTGAPDCTDRLAGCWRDLLYNQFHDILGGAALSDAYADAFNQLGRCRHEAGQIAHLSLQRIARDIRVTGGDAWNLVVWNMNGCAFSGWLEAEVQWAWEFDWYRGDICLTDSEGREIPCQCVLPRSVIPGFRSRFVFRADVPVMGWRVYHVHRRSCSGDGGEKASATEWTLLNGSVRVLIDRSTGGIAEIRETATDRLLMRGCARPVAVRDESDVWAFNFDGYGEEQPFSVDWVRVVENGPLRAAVKVRASHAGSFIEQTFILYRGSAAVEGRFLVNWNEKNETLKLCFDGCDELVVSSPGCAVNRALDGREMPCGEWIDMKRRDGTGELLVSDAFFAYDASGDGVVRASVLRSPIVGDLRIEPIGDSAGYEYMSQGISTGSWRLIPHGPADAAYPWREAASFNNRPLIDVEANHDGALPETGSWLQTEGSSAVLASAVKRAEDGSGDVVIRLQNFAGNRESLCVSPAGCDSFGAVLEPFEIRTMRFQNGSWQETDLLELI